MKLFPGHARTLVFLMLILPAAIPPSARGGEIPRAPLPDFKSYLPPDMLSSRTPDPPWLTYELRERRDADLSRFIRGYLRNQLPPGQDTRQKLVTIFYKRWNISMANILGLQVPSYPVEDLRMRDFAPFHNAPRFNTGLATGLPRLADAPLPYASGSSQGMVPDLFDRIEPYLVPILCGVMGLAALAFVIFALNATMMNRRMKGP